MDLFNNREIATVIWTILILGFVLKYPNVRSSFTSLAKTAVHPKLLAPFVLMALYVLGVVTVLRGLGLWTSSLIKETAMWFTLSGVALVFRFVPSAGDSSIGKVVLSDSLKIVILIEFLVGAYTFSLPVELVLVPFLVFVGLMNAFAETKEEYSQVRKLSSGVLAASGFAVIASAIIRASSDTATLGTLDTLRQITLAPLLAVAIIPFLYFFVAYTQYEQIFVQLGMKSYISPNVSRYAKRRLVRHLALRPRAIRRFRQEKGLDLLHIQTKEDVDRLLSDPREGQVDNK